MLQSPRSRLLALVLGLLLPPGGTGLRLAPPAGREVVRRWSASLDLSLDSIEESLDGRALDLQVGEVELAVERALELTDRFVEVDERGVATLERDFESSRREARILWNGEEAGGFEGRMPGDGWRVRFLRGEPGEGYRAEARDPGAQGGPSVAALEALEFDLDLAALLPPDEVEPGDTWELEPGALRTLFAAGGGLGLTGSLQAGSQGLSREVPAACALVGLREVFGRRADLEGQVEARYAGREGASEAGEAGDSGGLARIVITLEVRGEVDVSDTFAAMVRQFSELEGECELRYACELEGELVLLWDLDEQRLDRARFEGDAAFEGGMRFPVSLGGGPDPATFEGCYELSGEAVVELVCEAD